MDTVTKHVASRTVPSFDDIGLTEPVLKKCIESSGLVIFASSKEELSESAMASTIKYVLEQDTFIKGTLIYVGESNFSFHEIQSAHSMLIEHSSVVADSNFGQSNKSMMRRSGDLVAFKDADVDSMVDLALTGCSVFGQVVANSVVDVVESFNKEHSPEQRYTKMRDFVEATSMILCQRVIESSEGDLISVWEYLELNKSVKGQLLEILDSAASTEDVAKAIKGIVSNNYFGSQGFRGQADNLLNAGMISESSHSALIEADM